MTPLRKTRIPHDVEAAILALSAERPILGRIRAAAELNRRGVKATPSTVRAIWRRHELQNSEKRKRAFAPAQGSQVAAITHEVPFNSIPAHDYTMDALVLSVVAFTFIDSVGADTADQSSAHNFHLLEQATPTLAEDHAGLAEYDAPVETAQIYQSVMSHSDFVV